MPFRLDCSVDGSEGDTVWENGSSDSDAEVTREDRNNSGSCLTSALYCNII